MTEQSSSMKTRGNTVRNPATTKYSLWTWIKGYAAWAALLPVYCFLWAFARLCPRLPQWAVRKLLRWHEATTASRPCDVRIPGTPTIPAYMLRWWKIMRNAFFNVYFHQVFRSDDDAALHDHPWWSFSIVLEGGYFEHRIADGGVHAKTWYGPGSVLFRRAGSVAHRLELKSSTIRDMPVHEAARWLGHDAEVPLVAGLDSVIEQPAKTIFITGPVLRRWGFHHTDSWVDAYDWDAYLAAKGIRSMKMEGYAEQLRKTTK